MKLTRIRLVGLRKLRKYFAQSDVDVIQNFPLPGTNPQTQEGFSVDTYPYYSLSYYSNGKNRLLRLINKIKTNDKEIHTKLRAL